MSWTTVTKNAQWFGKSLSFFASLTDAWFLPMITIVWPALKSQAEKLKPSSASTLIKSNQIKIDNISKWDADVFSLIAIVPQYGASKS